jgi:hypothetical protein
MGHEEMAGDIIEWYMPYMDDNFKMRARKS